MKKEKTIKSYKRRTKTGKIVTVRQHTASYDASDKLKESLKKEGAGDELKRKKTSPLKERFDKAAIEVANRPDPKDMSDEDVIKEWEQLKRHWQLVKDGEFYRRPRPSEREMRTKDYSKRVDKLRDRYHEALSNRRTAKEMESVKKYMESRGITHDEVLAYAKKVGYSKSDTTGQWHFRGSHAPHPYSHVVQKAVALKKKARKK